MTTLTWRELSLGPFSSQSPDQTLRGEAQQPATTLADCTTFLLDRQSAESPLQHQWTLQTELTGLTATTNEQTAVLHVIVKLQNRAVSETEVPDEEEASRLHRSVHAYFSHCGRPLSNLQQSYDRLSHSLASLTLYAKGFDEAPTSIGHILQGRPFKAHLDLSVPTTGPVKESIALKDMVLEKIASLYNIPCRATDQSTDRVDMLATLEVQFGVPPVNSV